MSRNTLNNHIQTQSTLELGFKKNGYLHENRVESIKTVKCSNYTLLIIDNSEVLHHTPENQHFYLYRPNTSFKLVNNPDVYNCSKLYFLMFPPESIRSIMLQYRNYLNFRQVSTKTLKFKNNQYCYLFLESIKIISDLNEKSQENLLNYKMQDFLAYLVEVYGKQILGFISSKSVFDVSEFKTSMYKNVLNSLTLSELAFISNMSVSKFKRTFQEVFNDTPINWFRQRKVESSCDLLKNTTKTITDISELIGYQNPSNFIKVFKTYSGMTPNEYRELMI